MRRRADVRLGAVWPAVRKAAEEGWFDDEAVNYLLGFGKGYVGRDRARDFLEGLLQDPGAVGVFVRTTPVGIFRMVHLEPASKTARLWCFIAPEWRGKNVFPTAGHEVMERLYRQGVMRVEVEVLSMNKAVIQMLRKFGFTQEGIRRCAHWVGQKSYHLVHLRMLRKKWKEIHHDRRSASRAA